jgi:putative ABC transport system substrate-binding protein
LAPALLAVPLVSLAQLKEKVWRVGVLGAGGRPVSADMENWGGLVQGLRELGYVEGTNLVIEWRFAEGAYDRVPVFAAELVHVPVDVIVADGSPATRAAQDATRTIPIVFPACADPVADGLVKSLAHPGGNTTGISLLLGDTLAKQMEMLVSIVSGLSLIAVLYNRSNPTSQMLLKRIQDEAARSKLRVLPVGARSEPEIESAFSMMTREHVGAFLWIRDPFFNSRPRQIANLALRHGLPSLGGSRTFPEAGGLMAYAQNGRESLHRAATYIDKIFRGANPGDLPVEQPTKLELVINRKTARALGLTIPPELLIQADKVIE